MPLATAHKNAIIHNRLMVALPYHFPQLLTVIVETIEFNSFNEPIKTYTPDPTLTGLACYLEKNTTGNDEIQRRFAVVVTGAYACVLQGYFPQIDRLHFVDIEGLRYNVVDVANDAFKSMTVLGLERINENTELPYSEDNDDGE